MSKTYVPQMAKTMHYMGTYIHEHKTVLYSSIDADDRLTSEQKETAKKVLDEIVAAHGIFWTLHAVRSPAAIEEEMRRKGKR